MEKKFDSQLDGMSAEELVRLREQIDAALERRAEPKAAEESGRNRLDRLGAYKDNAAALKAAEEQKKQDKTQELIGKIKALKPRIDELIATGNACLESGIPMTGKAWGGHEGYDTHQFFTNSWSHLVGFVGRPGFQDFAGITMLGINAGGACGSYDFRTDGVRVFSVNERNPMDVKGPDIGYMQRFLDRFDAFESAFYAYVDKELEKQEQEVEKKLGVVGDLIDDATARSNAVGRGDNHKDDYVKD